MRRLPFLRWTRCAASVDRATVVRETLKQPRRDYETVMDLDEFAGTRPYLRRFAWVVTANVRSRGCPEAAALSTRRRRSRSRRRSRFSARTQGRFPRRGSGGQLILVGRWVGSQPTTTSRSLSSQKK